MQCVLCFACLELSTVANETIINFNMLDDRGDCATDACWQYWIMNPLQMKMCSSKTFLQDRNHAQLHKSLSHKCPPKYHCKNNQWTDVVIIQGSNLERQSSLKAVGGPTLQKKIILTSVLTLQFYNQCCRLFEAGQIPGKNKAYPPNWHVVVDVPLGRDALKLISGDLWEKD